MRTKEEYGGFLPLELNTGEEFFSEYSKNLSRFNTVKAAFDYLIRQISPSKIWIPYYYCPSTTEAIRRTGVEICFYHIDEGLMPENIPDENGSIVLLIDYFGVCGRKIKKIAETFSKAEIILDLAHAFFEKPLIKGNIHNVYSAKKFFGVPDGAYLISQFAARNNAKPTNAGSYAGYLIKAFEEGTNASYHLKKETDSLLEAHYGTMSRLSEGLLRNVDYERVRKKREENYRVLFKAFLEFNELSIPEMIPAYQFPLLLSDRGKEIKKVLIEQKIYVSTLWSGKELLEKGNSFELNMMNNAVFLPMDQRYNSEDMNYIIGIVEKELKVQRARKGAA